MRVLICGDRNWRDYASIMAYVTSLPDGSVVIEGDARGADRMAGLAATVHGLDIEVYPADWARYGKGAGPVRNKRMLDAKPDVVVFFHDDIGNSKGTGNMIQQAAKAGVRVVNGRTGETWSVNIAKTA